MTCSLGQLHTSPLCHLLTIPDIDTSHSCLWAPQTLPHPGAPSPERSSLWVTCFLGREAASPCPIQLQGEGRDREGYGELVRVEGSSLWHTGQKQGPGEGWGQRAGGHGFFWQRMEPSWGREITLPLPDSHVLTPSNQATHCPKTPDTHPS